MLFKNSLAYMLVGVLFLTAMVSNAAISDDTFKKLVGTWNGVLLISEERQLPLILTISSDGTGSLVNPERGNNELLISDVILVGGSVVFTVMQVDGDYKGTIDATFETIQGTWFQRGRETPLKFKRQESDTS
ncbi:MAG: hypothetical protein JKY60_16045 [Kordiimonadaceae bacterium]|nr:hypothetical protein [Kordiimonadaceae bacterium]